jgi:hypothetical protein
MRSKTSLPRYFRRCPPIDPHDIGRPLEQFFIATPPVEFYKGMREFGFLRFLPPETNPD